MDHIWRSTVMPGDHQWKEGFSSSDNPKMGPVVSRARVPITGEIQAEANDLLSGCVIEERRSISWVLEVADPWASLQLLKVLELNILVSSLVCVRCDWRIPVAKPGAHAVSQSRKTTKEDVRKQVSGWLLHSQGKHGQFESLLNVHREL